MSTKLLLEPSTNRDARITIEESQHAPTPGKLATLTRFPIPTEISKRPIAWPSPKVARIGRRLQTGCDSFSIRRTRSWHAYIGLAKIMFGLRRKLSSTTSGVPSLLFTHTLTEFHVRGGAGARGGGGGGGK